MKKTERASSTAQYLRTLFQLFLFEDGDGRAKERSARRQRPCLFLLWMDTTSLRVCSATTTRHTLMAHSRSSSEASTSRTSLEDGRKGTGTSRTSVDSERFSPSSPNGVHNGINGKHLSEASLNTSDPLAALEALRKEKEELAKQYADQTARFNNVKTTLGTKLRQFAVCRVISNAWF